MKKFYGIAAIAAAAAINVCGEVPTDPPTGTLDLKNGQVIFGRQTEVVQSPEHLNFCHGRIHTDGTLLLHHSIGIHGHERSGRKISRDGGATWQNSDPIPANTSFARLDGTSGKIDCWDGKCANEHDIDVTFYDKDFKAVSSRKFKVKLPFEAGMCIHGHPKRFKNGMLVANAYGRDTTPENKLCSYFIASKDDGETWEFFACPFRASLPYGKDEGPGEGVMIEAADGSLLAMCRTGDLSRHNVVPLIQSRSTDGGKTWSTPEVICHYGVSPDAELLANNTLVVVSGRPGIYMLVDFTGTGKNYEKIDIFKAPDRYQSSSYCSIPKIADDTVLLIYDISSFSTYQDQRKINHIFSMPITFKNNNDKAATTGARKFPAETKKAAAEERREVPTDPPTGAINLDQGRVIFGKQTEVVQSPEHLNFCHGRIHTDGTLLLHHSIGIHGHERSGRKISRDGGETWQNCGPIPANTSYARLDGTSGKIDCWDGKCAEEHEIDVSVFDKDFKKVSSKKQKVKLPFAAGMCIHGHPKRFKNGTLVANAYGRDTTPENKLCCYFLASRDDGNTWEFFACPFRASLPYGKDEGPSEGVMIEAADGSLLAMCRTGDLSRHNVVPLIQSRSTDGGKTWSTPEVICDYGVSPDAELLANNTLVVVSGRPGIYMLVDFTGTGRKYQKIDIFKAPDRYQSSSYCSIPKIADDKVLLIYDISSFSTYHDQRKINHIFSMPITFKNALIF